MRHNNFFESVISGISLLIFFLVLLTQTTACGSGGGGSGGGGGGTGGSGGSGGAGGSSGFSVGGFASAGPIKNATVQIYELDQSGNRTNKIAETTTNTDGNYTFNFSSAPAYKTLTEQNISTSSSRAKYAMAFSSISAFAALNGNMNNCKKPRTKWRSIIQ